MNRHILQSTLGLTLLLSAAAAAAGPGMPTLTANGLVFDCQAPAMPSQRQVGELTGQANFSQVYATRARVMGDVRRACNRQGITRVVVQRPSQPASTGLAVQAPVR
ncbi:hypothetical protein DT603_11735 [Pseudoxanthomonas gei]|uniref:Uncharacterized protein n=1 Tax=Pseudoxanthomonas gei TaxID=1383030 RepID=A0ABX0AD55_9GAMM|nr:hypothetical protein [Pseudoxanthomonas gei]NDK39512.1 hypothetical protein [Pseudoxanthomonas gei]